MSENPSAEREVVDGNEVETFVQEMVRRLDWRLDVTVRGGEEEGAVLVDLTGEDRDLVVQNRAEVLEVFQYLLNRIFGGPSRIVVDCDGYRARKEAELREIALRVSERVRRTGEEEELGLMNPYERRIVHLAVAETEGVTTESEGNGLMKRVVILPA